MSGDVLQVSSFQSLGGCDGPSLRSVVFLYGCPLRCHYCHNPETWWGEGFSLVSVAELAEKVVRNKSYFRQGGGVTLSGGEPLLQQEGAAALLECVKNQGIHTCVDTSASLPVSQRLLDATDLFLVDVKFLSGAEYLEYTGAEVFGQVVDFLEQTKKQGKPLWIRHVLFPGVTDSPDYVGRLVEFLADYPQIQRIDLLPYKSLCVTKYQNLALPFPMAGVPEPHPDLVAELEALLPF